MKNLFIFALMGLLALLSSCSDDDDPRIDPQVEGIHIMPENLYVGQPADLSVVLAHDANYFNYSWVIEDANSEPREVVWESADKYPSYTFGNNGYYTIKVAVDNGIGGVDYATKSLYINSYRHGTLYLWSSGPVPVEFAFYNSNFIVTETYHQVPQPGNEYSPSQVVVINNVPYGEHDVYFRIGNGPLQSRSVYVDTPYANGVHIQP